MASRIPAYSQPCLASRKDTQTIYLVGASIITKPATVSALEVNIIDITNTSNPVLQQSYLPTSKALAWNRNAPNICSPYLGGRDGNTMSEYTLHIQQLGVNTSWSTSFFPESRSFLDTRYYFLGTAFTSRRAYAIVGHQGFNSWVVALTNATAPWKVVQLNSDTGRPTVNSKVAISEPEPLLTVGTFTLTSTSPAPGHLIVFSKMGTGTIYPTISYENITALGERVVVSTPQAVNMNGVALTASAIYATLDSGAYILDKASDDTVATYFIDPTVTNALRRISTLNTSPPFASIMSATVAGSQLVLYSVSDDGRARLHFLNTTTNAWDTPFQISPKPDPSSSGSTNIWAIIGGAIAGVAVIVLLVLLRILRQRRRTSRNKESVREGKEELETSVDPSSQERVSQSAQQSSYSRAGAAPINVDGFTGNSRMVPPQPPSPAALEQRQHTIFMNTPHNPSNFQNSIQPSIVRTSMSQLPYMPGEKTELESSNIDRNSEGSPVASRSYELPIPPLPLSPPTIPARPQRYVHSEE